MKSDLAYYLSKIGKISTLSREEEADFFNNFHKLVKELWSIITDIFLKNDNVIKKFEKYKKKYKDYFIMLIYIKKANENSINKILNYRENYNLDFENLNLKDANTRLNIKENIYNILRYPINFEFFVYLKKNFKEIKDIDDKFIKYNNLINKIDILRNEFTKANLKLVISVAKRYMDLPLPWIDVIQEGNIGLFSAIERFNINMGYKFSTYASWWIRQSIIKAIIEKERTIKIPIHMLDKLSKIKKVMIKYLSLENRIPTLEEISEETNIKLEKINSILKYSDIRFVSFNSPIGDEHDKSLEEIIEDTKNEKTIDRLEKEEISLLISQKLDNLTEVQKNVITYKYGLYGKKILTLNEISDKLKLSTERIRQIQLKALFKLKKNIKNKKIFKKLLEK